ncbi:MAG TPA: CDP-alcohol phosphatidyltransferase family protein [Vicinamibacteria bacterium]|nr:CDP-alcohol phosphatidyltransferase family protein [Vicinamibacteria bacterium]
MTAPFPVFVVVLAAALLSIAVYGFLPRRDADADRRGSRFLLGLGDFLLHWFLWAIGPAERAALRLGLTPSALNATGLAIGLLGGLSIGFGGLELGGWAIVLSGVCDVLDGRIARARGLASAYGKFMDSTLDRFVEAFTFLGFAAYLRHRPWGAFMATAALAGSLLVSYAQSRGETVGVTGAGGLMQRGERLVLICLACLVDPTLTLWRAQPEGTIVVWVLAFIGVATFGTAIYRTAWIAGRLRGQGDP